MSRKDENDFTKTDEQTESLVEDAVIVESAPEGSNLLGDRPLMSRSSGTALLRLARGALKVELAHKLEMEPWKGNAPLVLGPYEVKFIETLVKEGLLGTHDEMHPSFEHWTPLSKAFPSLRDLLDNDGDEFTQTATATATATASAVGNVPFDTEDLEQPQTPEALELSNPDLIPGEERVVVKAAPKTAMPPPPSHAAHASPPPTPPPREKPMPQMAAAPAPRSTQQLLIGGLLLLAVVGIGVSRLRGTKNVAKVDDAGPQATAREEALARSWPESLRPRSESQLHLDDRPLMKRIRPILTAYERGSLLLSSTDEQALRSVADPASGDWEARKVAANQLAVFQLARMKTEEAKAILRPILEAAPTDAVTVLNLALIYLVEGDVEQARQLATQGTTTCAQGICWVAQAVLGLVEGAAGRIDGVEKASREALRYSSNNPFVYGLWLNSLMKADPSGRGFVPRLMKEALLSDPDRLVDSPIPAPIAGHILVAQALEGLKKGADFAPGRLSSGQAGFIRWLEGRYRLNPLNQPLSTVLDQLALESDPVSQVLYAYALRDRGSLEESAQVLSRALPLFDGKRDFFSCWPWTFAGDVQFARGKMDQALLYYNSALGRTPTDPAAMLGMALIFREKADFSSAEQRLAEAIQADPLFLPAALRLTRFEWQAQVRSQ